MPRPREMERRTHTTRAGHARTAAAPRAAADGRRRWLTPRRTWSAWLALHRLGLVDTVFVGGATVETYITDPAPLAPRVTLDVDVVVDTHVGHQFYGVEARLRDAGHENGRRVDQQAVPAVRESQQLTRCRGQVDRDAIDAPASDVTVGVGADSFTTSTASPASPAFRTTSRIITSNACQRHGEIPACSTGRLNDVTRTRSSPFLGSGLGRGSEITTRHRRRIFPRNGVDIRSQNDNVYELYGKLMDKDATVSVRRTSCRSSRS